MGQGSKLIPRRKFCCTAVGYIALLAPETELWFRDCGERLGAQMKAWFWKTMSVLAATMAVSPVFARDLVVGVEDLEYYPLFAVREGDYVGTGREILDAFADAKGHHLTYRPLPINRLFTEFRDGRVDLKFPDNAMWGAGFKAGRNVVYSKPVIAYIDGVMVRPMNLGRGADQVRVLGTISGFRPFNWNELIAEGVIVVKELPRLETVLKLAAAGKVDGAYASVSAANHVMGQLLDMKGALVFDPALPHVQDYYYLSSLNQPEIIAEFDQWLVENAPLVQSIKERMKAEQGVK